MQEKQRVIAKRFDEERVRRIGLIKIIYYFRTPQFRFGFQETLLKEHAEQMDSVEESKRLEVQEVRRELMSCISTLADEKFEVIVCEINV